MTLFAEQLRPSSPQIIVTFTLMHLANAFIQSDLQCIQATHIHMCVPWELNPQPFALLTQCSTTEPQEHSNTNPPKIIKNNL